MAPCPSSSREVLIWLQPVGAEAGIRLARSRLRPASRGRSPISSGGEPRDALIPSDTVSPGTISRVLSRRRTLSMLLYGCEEVEPRASGGPVIRRAVVCLSGRVATVHRDLLSVGP